MDVQRVDSGGKSDYIFRLQEMAGVAESTVTLNSAFAIEHAELTIPDEQRRADLPTPPIRLQMRMHETVTVRLRFP